MARPSICRRLDLALARVSERRMAVRAIILNGTDLARLGKARKGHVAEYAGHPVRVGATSRIYSTHGVGVHIPVKAP